MKVGEWKKLRVGETILINANSHELEEIEW
jgi:hypothetical protein